MLRDEDTRPLRPAGSVRRVSLPYAMVGVAKSLWNNDKGLVTVRLIAEGDTEAVDVAIYGPGLIPIRVRAIELGTTARDILALYG